MKLTWGGEDVALPNVSYCEDGKVYYNPIVEPASSYVAVDLGLPSGRLWADRNVGATSPEEAGLYFAWGDTVGYTRDQVGKDKAFSSDWSDYFDTNDGGKTFNKYTTDKLTRLEASDDAATVNMGSDWRMPTYDDLRELTYNTTYTFIDLQGNEFSESEATNGAIAEGNLKGVKFTGSNGNSIFIPALGICVDSGCVNINSQGTMLTSDLIWDPVSDYGLGFWYDSCPSISYLRRCFGNQVRGVK